MKKISNLMFNQNCPDLKQLVKRKKKGFFLLRENRHNYLCLSKVMDILGSHWWCFYSNEEQENKLKKFYKPEGTQILK